MNSLLLLLLLTIAMVESTAAAPQESVILIHGLGRTPLSMISVQWTLRRAGYQVINLRYPSRRYSIEHLAEDFLGPTIAAQTQSHPGPIHFVTHSLGGIILRQYLADHTMTNLGRVVMLAPPNHGSKKADRFKKSAVGRWILGPAGCELGTGPSGLPERLSPPHFQLGIIAAASDGKVPASSAKLEGMTDFRVVPGWHTWIMWRTKTLRQTLAFLKDGHFLRCACPKSASFSLL